METGFESEIKFETSETVNNYKEKRARGNWEKQIFYMWDVRRRLKRTLALRLP